MSLTVRLLCLAGAWAILHPAAQSAERSGESNRPTVAALIAQLGDKNYRLRQAAGQALEERGEESLPELRAAANHPDEEIRRRIEVLTRKIERAVLFSPRRVTLQMKDALAADVIRELSRQTGYRLQYQGNQQRRLTLDMVRVTYWEALEKISNDLGLSPGFDEQQGIVYLYEQNTHSPHTFHSGPFRFVATNFNYNRYINLANIPRNMVDPNNPNDNSLNFGFMVQAEPKIPLLAMSPPRLSKAEDENGGSLLPRLYDNGQPFTVHYYEGNGLYRNFQQSTSIQMARPSKEATRAKLIKGTVTVTVLSGTRPDVVFDAIPMGKKKARAVGQTAEIEIEDVKEQNKTYTITLVVKRIARHGEQDYNWINGVAQKLELTDAQGRKYLSQGVMNFLNNTPTSIHAVFQFGPPPSAEIGPAAKLAFNQWLTISHELEFEFKDLPLP